MDGGDGVMAWIAEAGAVARLVLGQPVMTTALLAELRRLLTNLAPRPLVISSNHPRIFLAGAHLGQIAALDEDTSRDYSLTGREVMWLIASHPAPVVAAVDGVCAGGGFDLVMSCDAIVAGTGALFAHPGVGRGLVTGWGGTLTLRRRAPWSLAAGILLQAQPVAAEVIASMGLVRPVPGESTTAATAEASRLASLHPSRLGLWRSFRTRHFVDSFRAFVVHNE